MNPTSAALQYSIEFDDTSARESASRMGRALEVMESIVRSIGEAAITAKNEAMGAAGAVASYFEKTFDKLQQLSRMMLSGPVSVAQKFYQLLADSEPVWFRIRTQAQSYTRSLLEVTGEQKRQLDGLNKQLTMWEKMTTAVKEHKKAIQAALIATAPLALGAKGMIEQDRLKAFLLMGKTEDQVDTINKMANLAGIKYGHLGKDFEKEGIANAYLAFSKSQVPMEKLNDALLLTIRLARTTNEPLQNVAESIADLWVKLDGNSGAIDKWVGTVQGLSRVVAGGAPAVNAMMAEYLPEAKEAGVTGTAAVSYAASQTALRGAFKGAGVESSSDYMTQATRDIAMGPFGAAIKDSSSTTSRLLALLGLRGDVARLQKAIKEGHAADVSALLLEGVGRKMGQGSHELKLQDVDLQKYMEPKLGRPENVSSAIFSMQTNIDQAKLEATKNNFENIRGKNAQMGKMLPGLVSLPTERPISTEEKMSEQWNAFRGVLGTSLNNLQIGLRKIIYKPVGEHLKGATSFMQTVSAMINTASPTHLVGGIAATYAGWKLAVKPLLKLAVKGGIGALGTQLIKHSQGGWKYVGHALKFLTAPFEHTTKLLKAVPGEADWAASLASNSAVYKTSWQAKLGAGMEKAAAKFGFGAAGKLGMLGKAAKVAGGAAKWVGERVVIPVSALHDARTVAKSLQEQNIGEDFVEMFTGDFLSAYKRAGRKFEKAFDESWLIDFTGSFKDKSGRGLFSRAMEDAGKTYAEWWDRFTHWGEEAWDSIAQKVTDFKTHVSESFDGLVLGVVGLVKKFLPDSLFRRMFPGYEQIVKAHEAAIAPPAAAVVTPHPKVSAASLLPGSPAYMAHQAKMAGTSAATFVGSDLAAKAGALTAPEGPQGSSTASDVGGATSTGIVTPRGAGRQGDAADAGGIEGMIAKAVKVAGIEQYAKYFHAIIQQESGLNVNAPDRVEAKIHDRSVGPAQVLLGTGKEMGFSEAQLRDPQTNLIAGAKYFAEMLQEHRGDLHAAIAAYNGKGTAAEKYAQSVEATEHRTDRQAMASQGPQKPVVAASLTPAPAVASPASTPPGEGGRAASLNITPKAKAPVVNIDQESIVTVLKEMLALMKSPPTAPVAAKPRVASLTPASSYGSQLTSFAQ